MGHWFVERFVLVKKISFIPNEITAHLAGIVVFLDAITFSGKPQ